MQSMPEGQSRSFDTVVVGGGIAGVSAAWALARQGHDVALVEREASLAAHSTGRSAAQFLASYGGPVGRAVPGLLRRAGQPDPERGVAVLPGNQCRRAAPGFPRDRAKPQPIPPLSQCCTHIDRL